MFPEEQFCCCCLSSFLPIGSPGTPPGPPGPEPDDLDENPERFADRRPPLPPPVLDLEDSPEKKHLRDCPNKELTRLNAFLDKVL